MTLKAKMEPVQQLLKIKIPGMLSTTESTIRDFERRKERYGWDYALEGCDDLFLHTARAYVAKEIHAALTMENPKTLQELRAMLHARMVEGARWGVRSTSIPNNLMRQYKLQATTEMWETINNLLNNLG